MSMAVGVSWKGRVSENSEEEEARGTQEEWGDGKCAERGSGEYQVAKAFRLSLT
jgi:hypothetical protein